MLFFSLFFFNDPLMPGHWLLLVPGEWPIPPWVVRCPSKPGRADWSGPSFPPLSASPPPSPPLHTHFGNALSWMSLEAMDCSPWASSSMTRSRLERAFALLLLSHPLGRCIVMGVWKMDSAEGPVSPYLLSPPLVVLFTACPLVALSCSLLIVLVDVIEFSWSCSGYMSFYT